jgi:hypothetical protein
MLKSLASCTSTQAVSLLAAQILNEIPKHVYVFCAQLALPEGQREAAQARLPVGVSTKMPLIFSTESRQGLGTIIEEVANNPLTRAAGYQSIASLT